jgi:hypothetical protein
MHQGRELNNEEKFFVLEMMNNILDVGFWNVSGAIFEYCGKKEVTCLWAKPYEFSVCDCDNCSEVKLDELHELRSYGKGFKFDYWM